MRKSEFEDFEEEDINGGSDINTETDLDDDIEFENIDAEVDDEYTEEDFDDMTEVFGGDGDETDEVLPGEPDGGDDGDEPGERKGLPLAAKIGFGFLAVVIALAAWLLGTNSGRSLSMRFVARFVKQSVSRPDIGDDTEDTIDVNVIPSDEISDSSIEVDENGNIIIRDSNGQIIVQEKEPRSEDYVKTFLLFGIEQIDGAANTDAIMLVSVNTKDNTIKMTSLLRDTYVDIPGWDKNKLNSAYAKGAYGAETGAEARAKGAALLIRTIEQTYDVKISGYACVNFSSFEKVINRLGGIDIELGEKEARYLNKTNYISNPEYRNVKAGWNHLNGNQALGYCRVRKVVTLGGANNDYGRTVRQRRVISAIIAKYKSTKLTDLISLTQDLLGYVHTNLSEDQIHDLLTEIVNNGISETVSMRLPAEEYFKDSGETGIFNGTKTVTYTLVIDDYIEENIKAFHKFLFLDEDEEGTPSEGGNGTE